MQRRWEEGEVSSALPVLSLDHPPCSQTLLCPHTRLSTLNIVPWCHSIAQTPFKWFSLKIMSNCLPMAFSSGLPEKLRDTHSHFNFTRTIILLGSCYAKKLLVYVKFKFNWVSYIFICQICRFKSISNLAPTSLWSFLFCISFQWFSCSLKCTGIFQSPSFAHTGTSSGMPILFSSLYPAKFYISVPHQCPHIAYTSIPLSCN